MHFPYPPGSLRSPIGNTGPLASDLNDRPLVCLSHLRWDLVFQRPQHLMTRFARMAPVFFVEEPIVAAAEAPHLDRHEVAENLSVLVPHLPAGMTQAETVAVQNWMLANFFRDNAITAPVLWFYTPAALEFANDLPAAVTVYDCMDELSAFRNAAPELHRLEAALLNRADVVFTGGVSLYEAKRDRHHNVHALPSAVDAAHFATARAPIREPDDQRVLPHPRLGFFGVIDERLDCHLVEAVARARPDWHLVMIGPVVKIDPGSLPRAPNIHYLGRKAYAELPAYIAAWDVAMMPFALNEATRFISPTKTPEYLAAGKPVVSTPIVDVVRGWGHLDAVRIAASAPEFVRAAEAAMSLGAGDRQWREAADRELAKISWDRTWARMADLTAAAMADREREAAAASRVAVQFSKEDSRV